MSILQLIHSEGSLRLNLEMPWVQRKIPWRSCRSIFLCWMSCTCATHIRGDDIDINIFLIYFFTWFIYINQIYKNNYFLIWKHEGLKDTKGSFPKVEFIWNLCHASEVPRHYQYWRSPPSTPKKDRLQCLLQYLPKIKERAISRHWCFPSCCFLEASLLHDMTPL